MQLVKINEDRYILNTVDKSIDNKSLVTVLVIESDEEGNVSDRKSYKINLSKWETTELVSSKFKRFKLVDVNSDNNFTLNIKNMNIDPETVQIMYFIEEMVYLSSCFHIKIDTQKITDYTYKVSLTQKYCDIQNMIHKKSGYNNTQNDILTDVGSCRYEIDMESNEDNILIEDFFTITSDGKQLGKSKLHAYAGGGLC